MAWYCGKCRCLHSDTELCPQMCDQLKQHPEWLSEAADFTSAVGQYHLITSNTLDTVSQEINRLVGTNLAYEGSHQVARDIQVFNRLNTEAFCKAGVFSSSETAKTYLENATHGQFKGLVAKINGSSQEVDWLRDMQGQLSSVFQKSELLNKNAPGVDGVTVSRWTGKTISRTTVKASQSYSGINTNVQQVVKAIKLDRLAPDEIVYGVEGTKARLLSKLDKEIQFALKNNDTVLAEKLAHAKKTIAVVENNNPAQVAKNSERIMDKIAAGKATPHVIAQDVTNQMVKGAVIGAAINLSISSISNFVRLKNGEISLNEAITETSESTIKGVITGASLSAITLFLPAGPLGFIAGVGIGLYVDKACGNLLDEIYGKGAYGAILDASGYVYGMTINLQDAIDKITANVQKTEANIRTAQKLSVDVQRGFDEFEQLKGE